MTLGVLLLLGGELLFFIQNKQVKEQKQTEIEMVQTFMENQQSYETLEETDHISTQNLEYIAVIEIPKIGLIKGIFDIDNVKNDVNQNIQLMKESDYPNVEKGNMILAGHSGIGKATYFNHLNQLHLGDYIFIYYQGMKYTYQTIQTYEVEKTGKVGIQRNDAITILTLITCHFHTNQQLIVIAKQIKQEPMG